MAKLDDSSQVKLTEIRQNLKAANLSAVVLSKNDPHRLEYSDLRDNGIYFASGFDGSAGLGAVTTDNAAVFVDGRYTLQVKDQVDSTLFEFETLSLTAVVDWLAANLPQGARIGFTASKFSVSEIDRYKALLYEQGLELVLCDDDIALSTWDDRPVHPIYPIEEHPIKFAGKSVAQKLIELRKDLERAHATACFLNSIESVAWLFNLRAPKRAYMPASDAFAFVPVAGKATLFLPQNTLSEALKNSLEDLAEIVPYFEAHERLTDLAKGTQFLVDPDQNSMKDFLAVKETAAKIILKEDPTALKRAIKNESEIQGALDAHKEDAIAVIQTLSWLKNNFCKVAAPETITELDVVTKLYDARSRLPNFQGISFDTISGSGPNGAIVHYRVTQKTNRTLKHNEVFLLDSGGQFPAGTTDITRTIFLGDQAPQDIIKQYTLVLKGHLALKRQLFPKGTTGSALDTIARQYLWNEGLDYAHGTGHGVGSYLGVHEGPQRISPLPNKVALVEGMILSNEPGCYQTGSHGIRIENLVYVVAKKPGFLGFENLTCVPYARTLIDLHLLSPKDIEDINAYHKAILTHLGDKVSSDAKLWLQNACAPL